MTLYRADMHIHTILSPCGSLEMSPVNILKEAARNKLDMIGITDHNTTRQCAAVRQLAEGMGITVICGAEVNTREEIHCIALFGNDNSLGQFQLWLDRRLPDIRNNPEKFGDQVWVDVDENIAGEEPRLLISAINASLEETQQMVHSLGGVFIAAHADKTRNSVISQLGFIPDDVVFDAIEISSNTDKELFIRQFPYLKDYSFITSSDAHYLHQIGSAYTEIEMHDACFESLKQSLKFNGGITCISNRKKS